MQLLDSKPLFLHTLEKLLSCDFIDEVYLDSESEKIFEMASDLNFKKLKRDKKLAKNSTDGNQLFLNEVKHANADIYVQILCTSPFIEVSTIKKGVERLKNNKAYDSVVLDLPLEAALVRTEGKEVWGEHYQELIVNTREALKYLSTQDHIQNIFNLRGVENPNKLCDIVINKILSYKKPEDDGPK